MNAGFRRGDFQAGPYYRLALLEFALPLVFLLPVRFLFGEFGGLSIEVFLFGTGIELGLCVLLVGVRDRFQIGPRRFYFYDFLVRLIVGLPFTVYLIVVAPYSIIGLLRFLPLYLYFLDRARFRFALQYLLFFLPGSLFFALLKDFPYPGRVQTITIFVGTALGLILFLRERERLLAGKKSLEGDRERLRLARRLQHISARETATLAALLPPAQVRLFQENRPLHPEGAESLIVAFRFPDLDTSLQDFADAIDAPSRAKALDDFAGEWNRFLLYLREAAGRQNLIHSRKGENLLCVTRLPEGGEAGLRARVFSLIFWIQDISRYAARARRLLEQRGRRGWHVRVALGRGLTFGLPQSGGSPAWMILGPGVATIESFLDTPPLESKHQDEVRLQPGLHELVAGYYLEGSGNFSSGWYSPGYLQAAWARDEHGLEPAADFFERLRFSADQGERPAP